MNDTGRIIGAEWASRPDIVRAGAIDHLLERPACPICGHPSNDCTGHEPLPTSNGEAR